MGSSCARGQGAWVSSGCESDLGDGCPRDARHLTSAARGVRDGGLAPGPGVLGAGEDRRALVEGGTRPRSSRSSFLTGVRDLRVMSPQFFSVGGQTRVTWAVRGRKARNTGVVGSRPIPATSPRGQSPEPNPALPGRPQPLPASSETSIGETGFEPATARPPAGCATRLRHSPWCSSEPTPTWSKTGAGRLRGRPTRWVGAGCALRAGDGN